MKKGKAKREQSLILLEDYVLLSISLKTYLELRT